MANIYLLKPMYHILLKIPLFAPPQELMTIIANHKSQSLVWHKIIVVLIDW